MKKRNLYDLESELEKRARMKEKRKIHRMKVSGADVKKLKKLIQERIK